MTTTALKLVEDITEAKPVNELRFHNKDLALIRSTSCPSHIKNHEFDEFIHICQHVGLNPLLKQIYCFIFNPNDEKKRNLTPVTSIHGLSAVAARQGNYRPPSAKPEYEYEADLKDKDSNPLGISSVSTTVYQYAHGEWFPIVGEAYWDEFAPLVNGHWKNRQFIEYDKPKLDPKKEAWSRMPRLMLAKCAKAQAIRSGWPQDCSKLFTTDEIDKQQSIDLTATELVDNFQKDKRTKMLGGPTLLIDWLDGNQMQNVKMSDFHGQFMDFVNKCKDEPMTVLAFRDRNRHSLRNFWENHKDEALNIKREIELIEGQTA